MCRGQCADSCCSNDPIPNSPSPPPLPSLQTPQPCQTEEVGRSSWAGWSWDNSDGTIQGNPTWRLGDRSCSDISANKVSVFPGKEVTPCPPTGLGWSPCLHCLPGWWKLTGQAASLLWAWCLRTAFRSPFSPFGVSGRWERVWGGEGFLWGEMASVWLKLFLCCNGSWNHTGVS